ncbi:thioesterase II family protein [Clostridium hydrogenum]|uniref:thioesterase II family protein n=1 Tax=Clostridium hydrogenum TaxID=2855764 RepID=UPI001F3E5771|nr:thioesterase domain-containing protein [Clostridium hydrogenum]
MKKNKIKLFCIPHAGGSAASYFKLRECIGDSMEVILIELAGRGKRYNDKFYDSIDEAVKDVYKSIKDDMDCEYAIFGHSMGSLIAYELVHYIKRLKGKLPINVFFSGRKAPNVIYENNFIHKLQDEELKNEILQLSGTPKEVFENKRIFDSFLPILRADFKICEEYKYKEKQSKLDCDITILNGTMDNIRIGDIAAWKMHTNKKCSIYFFEGGHFYINDNWESISKIIYKTIFGG